MKKLTLIVIFLLNFVFLFGQILPDSTVLDTLQLEEVIVENTVKRIDNKFDRKVVAVSETQKAAARSVLDILRTLPGVVVDNDGNVRYKGAEASIQVDEQDLNKIFGKIEMIPVERIDKIELIDVAMRTGGSGRGGIINIKLKPIRDYGFSGMISARLNTVNFKELNNSREFGNINYKNNKFTFFANSTLETANHYEWTNKGNDFSELNLPNFQTITDNEYWKRTGIHNYIGGFYNPSANTQFYLSLCYLTQDQKDNSLRSFSETNKLDKSQITDYQNDYFQDDNQIWTGAYLSFKQKLDTLDTYLKVNLSYYLQKISTDENSTYNYQKLNATSTDSIYKYSNIRDLTSNNLFFNIFFNHSISEKTRWNVSYNLAFDWINPLIYRQYILDELNLPAQQSSTNLNQRHNLSSRFGTEWKKWKFDAGLNLQGEWNDGQFVRYNASGNDTTLVVKNHYIRMLPSATIAFLPNEATEIKASFAKTAEFPYFLQLSDYVDKNNLYRWQSGNFALKPVDFYAMYLSYTYEVDKWNASAELFYNFTNNDIKNVSIPVNSLIFLTKPENIAKKSDVGIDLSAWYQITRKLNFTLSTSIYHTNFDLNSLTKTAAQQGLILPELTRRQFGYDIKYSMEYTLLKDIYTMFYVNYYSKELAFNGYEKGYVNSAFNVSKKFFNNKLRLTLSVNNIFSNFVKRGSYSNNFGVISNTFYGGTPYRYTYGISLQYDFNKGDRGTKDLK
ncbi:TonB-dependent receptor [Bacteroidia bacterium]|nr:TonB-dependent receptor [Bacteroidia bacterium]GHV44303.1 TonB-dependent receptor [Bacteroidia bacterium]